MISKRPLQEKFNLELITPLSCFILANFRENLKKESSHRKTEKTKKWHMVIGKLIKGIKSYKNCFCNLKQKFANIVMNYLEL